MFQSLQKFCDNHRTSCDRTPGQKYNILCAVKLSTVNPYLDKKFVVDSVITVSSCGMYLINGNNGGINML